jgi:hypothetical protein
VVDGGKDRIYQIWENTVSAMPDHGRIDCTKCFKNIGVVFDETKRSEGDWRITANPLAWGNPQAEIVVLGFSKGPTQAGALSSTPHNDIAYKGSRRNVGKILAHIGLIEKVDPDALKRNVDQLIADENGRFHFGSLIRCTVERYDRKAAMWKGSGGGMLDKFVGTSFGKEISSACTTRFLADLPAKTRLVIMFGLGSKNNYVDSAFELFKRARPGDWKRINQVAYTDGRVTVVHVEHFASQGALIPNWLGEKQHDREIIGNLAIDAVSQVI